MPDSRLGLQCECFSRRRDGGSSSAFETPLLARLLAMLANEGVAADVQRSLTPRPHLRQEPPAKEAVAANEVELRTREAELQTKETGWLERSAPPERSGWSRSCQVASSSRTASLRTPTSWRRCTTS